MKRIIWIGSSLIESFLFPAIQISCICFGRLWIPRFVYRASAVRMSRHYSEVKSYDLICFFLSFFYLKIRSLSGGPIHCYQLSYAASHSIHYEWFLWCEHFFCLLLQWNTWLSNTSRTLSCLTVWKCVQNSSLNILLLCGCVPYVRTAIDISSFLSNSACIFSSLPNVFKFLFQPIKERIVPFECHDKTVSTIHRIKR